MDVIARTKGKGFQGVVKRHGFAGGGASHGCMTHRRGGSYGMRTRPGTILKNQKMPGHAGHRSRTVQNLIILKVVPEKNVLVVKGSVPGFNGALVVVRKAKKAM
ncbi:MAG: 50S ribosomal protein L3 [Puniceicoccales bacterium]|nr:50S ribosomal protein L3 [Puniceicoccales bacterium]